MSVPTYNGTYNWIAIGAVLSKGGYVSIYRIAQKQSVEVSGYVLKRSNKDDAKARNAIEEEIRILKELKDLDCVPEVIDHGSNDNGSWYVMEEFNPLSLENIKDVSDALSIIEGTVSALKRIHENNVAHRDIKRENILRKKNGAIVICDFGVSINDETEEGLIPFDIRIGRRINIPEEMVYANYLNTVDNPIRIFQKSDIYMFGFFVLEILTKQKGADTRLSYKEFSRIIKETWGIEKGSVFLYELVQECTHVEYTKRCTFATVESYIDKFKECQTGIISSDLQKEIMVFNRDKFISEKALDAEYITYTNEACSDSINSFLEENICNGLSLEWNDERIKLSGVRVKNVGLELESNDKKIRLVVQELRVFPRDANVLCEIMTGENPNAISLMDSIFERQVYIGKGEIIKICAYCDDERPMLRSVKAKIQ